MKIYTHNFNPTSNSGPNKFTRQLFRKMECTNNLGFVDDQQHADVEFCLIQQQSPKVKPMVLRLDGIWFNSDQNYKQQNIPIKLAYDNADAVIFQSEFNKQLTESWFGKHENSHVIHNAPDLNIINSELINDTYQKINWPWDKKTEVWSCASSWRPHKRLKENIRYFLEFAPKDAVLGVAGGGITSEDINFSNDSRIHFFGELSYQQLLCLYKRSTTFIHLAYLDHCPNVVVDAQAAGCTIICSSTGGTKEIVTNGIVIQEAEWDFIPIQLYKPPRIDFNNFTTVKNKVHLSFDETVDKYYQCMRNIK